MVFTQRFSSRLLFYPHFHAVIPDGIFALDGQGGVVFHELHPKQEDLVQIVKRIARKTARLVKRLDLGSIEVETLDQVRAQAAQGELALRGEAREVRQSRLSAAEGGFSLQAARHLHENDREGLSFLLRYNLRPPLALTRMTSIPVSSK